MPKEFATVLTFNIDDNTHPIETLSDIVAKMRITNVQILDAEIQRLQQQIASLQDEVAKFGAAFFQAPEHSHRAG